jgi:hypothetical protein
VGWNAPFTRGLNSDNPQARQRIVGDRYVSGTRSSYGEADQFNNNTPQTTFEYLPDTPFDEIYINYWVYMDPVSTVTGTWIGQWKVIHINSAPCINEADNDQEGGVYFAWFIDPYGETVTGMAQQFGSVDEGQYPLKWYATPAYLQPGFMTPYINFWSAGNTHGVSNGPFSNGWPKPFGEWVNIEWYLRASSTLGGWGPDNQPGGGDDIGRDGEYRIRLTRAGQTEPWDFWWDDNVITHMDSTYVVFEQPDYDKDAVGGCNEDNPNDGFIPIEWLPQWTRINFYNSWFNGGGLARYWFDDIYIQFGSQARVILGNAPTYELSTKLAMLKPTTWSDNSITATVSTGTFAPLDNVYLFIIKADGEVSPGLPVTIQ